jgi:hypothetical protein
VDAQLGALDDALPGSIVFAWLSALTLRRLGRLSAASERMAFVSTRAHELRLTMPLYRLAFNRAQAMFGTLDWAGAAGTLQPLVSAESRCAARRCH